MSSAAGNPWLDPAVSDYVAARTEQPDDVLADLVTRTIEATGDRAGMQIAPHQGALIGLLVRLTGARRGIEVGTFTGYSSIVIARALGAEGHLLCCDVSEHWTAMAREAWERAGLSDRIELRLGPAADTLRSLPAEPTYDVAFIDADKGRYQTYYDELVPRMQPNGLILIDNTLRSGAVVTPPADDDEPETAAVRAFNDHVWSDERTESYVLPVADGLTIVRVR